MMSAAETLITMHLDTWSSAIKAKSSAGRGGSKKREFYGIKKLRELILELAVRGLLVPQNPSDEPATQYLKRVALKKVMLVKEGRIRKQSPLEPVSDHDIQFSLPQNWQWEKLGNLVEMYNGRAFKSSEWADDGLPIVRIQNLNDTTATFNYFNGELSEDHRISDGEFLISWSGTPGTSFGAFIWRRGEAALNQHINKCVFHDDEANLEFMRLLVTGQMSHFILNSQGGVGLKHVTKGTLNNAVLGIPPPAEQNRIVAKVDELMALCDHLEQQQEGSARTHGTLVQTLLGALTAASERGQFKQAWQCIEANFDTLFTTESSIDQLKQTILQLAVMGKLVEQDAEDESTDELLRRCLAERTKLKLTKLTVVHVLPVEDALGYDIPESWRWQRLEDLLVFGPTNGFSPNAVEYETPVRSLTLSATTSGRFKEEHSKFITTEVPSDSDLWLKDGDILVQRGNSIEYVGVATVYRGESNRFVYPDLMMKLRVSSAYDVNYIHLAMSHNTAREFLRARASGTSGSMPKINQKTLNSLPIPIPPFDEQKRIVGRVKELMTFCDHLKASLQTARVTQQNLADSLVEAAIH